MTEFEIVSAIENYVTSNEGVTNFPVSQAQIADEVNTLRMRMIQELDMARQFVRPWEGYTQVIEGTSTTRVGTDYEIELPKIYTLANGWPAISYIGSTDWTEPYRVVNGNEHLYMSDSPTPEAPYAWVIGNKIKIRNVEPKKISILAVFEKPRDLRALFGYDPETTPYPMPQGGIDQIIGKTAESYLRTMYRIFPQANVQADIPQTPQQ